MRRISLVTAGSHLIIISCVELPIQQGEASIARGLVATDIVVSIATDVVVVVGVVVVNFIILILQHTQLGNISLNSSPVCV